MSTRTNRRELLRQGALAGAGIWLGGRGWASGRRPGEKLAIACIGVGGRGQANLDGVAGENIVALCDVDEPALASAAQRFPQAQKYADFRKLLEQPGIDAVVVSTPDHTHAVAANMALQLGKHVYCEKPLTHSIFEARTLARSAAARKVATQMGNAGHSSESTRRVVELIRAGAVGPVRAVHAWTDRPIWPQGIGRPAAEPVPSTVQWDLWLGPAPERPYSAAYHPFKWRGFWDFGTGALGDMACHIIDPAFWALDLGAPLAVAAEGEPRSAESGPRAEVIRFEFPARGEMPPVTLTWYDGGRKPPAELAEGETLPDNGSLFIGDRGKLLAPHGGGGPQLLPAAQFADFKAPEPSLPRSPGHHAEWILACKTGSPTGTHFGYAGPLTELVLLGIVAFRTGQRIEWDSANMRARNCPEAEPLIRREYRPGWVL
jgi:predicted dehydrogenase